MIRQSRLDGLLPQHYIGAELLQSQELARITQEHGFTDRLSDGKVVMPFMHPYGFAKNNTSEEEERTILSETLQARQRLVAGCAIAGSQLEIIAGDSTSLGKVWAVAIRLSPEPRAYASNAIGVLSNVLAAHQTPRKQHVTNGRIKLAQYREQKKAEALREKLEHCQLGHLALSGPKLLTVTPRTKRS